MNKHGTKSFYHEYTCHKVFVMNTRHKVFLVMNKHGTRVSSSEISGHNMAQEDLNEYEVGNTLG